MIRSFVAHVSAVTGVDEVASFSIWDPSLLVTTILEPPLPSSIAIARYLPPLGENAAALGCDDASWVGAPEVGNSTSDPGTSGPCVVTPSCVGVGLAGAGVALDVVVGDVAAEAGRSPTVLTSDPSGE